ncbi:MAG TPA: NADH-quinone oxidoreductase subunit A [Bryobacteraceae bacterium]|nr:NADH-quinone oxidoreductase subunit A [Bryobacteraceae bacterium]
MTWSLALYAALVLALAAAILAISYLAGQRHTAPAMGQPYEGGIVSEGSAHVRLSARFYLVAMFFVIFDLESVFIFAWALAARELGWPGYWDILIFAGVLGIALAYLWRIGGLDWSGELRSGRK